MAIVALKEESAESVLLDALSLKPESVACVAKFEDGWRVNSFATNEELSFMIAILERRLRVRIEEQAEGDW